MFIGMTLRNEWKGSLSVGMVLHREPITDINVYLHYILNVP
jgi:hypothetical protein